METCSFCTGGRKDGLLLKYLNHYKGRTFMNISHYREKQNQGVKTES